MIGRSVMGSGGYGGPMSGWGFNNSYGKNKENAKIAENMLAMNEALLLGSLRQQEVAEVSDNLSKELYTLNIKRTGKLTNASR